MVRMACVAAGRQVCPKSSETTETTLPSYAVPGGFGRRLALSGILALGSAAALAVFVMPDRAVIAPPPAVEPVPVALPSAEPQPVPLPALTEVELRRGDTLLDVLQQAGIGPAEAHAAVGSLREVTNLRRLQIGQRLGLALEPGGSADAMLAQLVLPLDATTEIHLVRGEDGGFAASSVARTLRSSAVAVAAPIDDSFYAAGRGAGLSPQILAQMIRLLSWDVDFQRDLHPGDRLEVVYQRLLDEDGEHVADGELDFVGLASGTRVIEAYRHASGEGRSDFYDRHGRSLRKWLLRTPVDGARLSSGFGARRHPILGYTRLHRGVDFAAPKGTPVLAAGAGVVEAAGRNRGYGNYVRLRHNRDFVTAYAHLARFAPGLRPGHRVEQGQVIGFVGATGLATGPHLHYELLEAGRAIDPMSVDLAGGEALQGAELARFATRRDVIDRQRLAVGGLVAGGRPMDRPPAAL